MADVSGSCGQSSLTVCHSAIECCVPTNWYGVQSCDVPNRARKVSHRRVLDLVAAASKAGNKGVDEVLVDHPDLRRCERLAISGVDRIHDHAPIEAFLLKPLESGQVVRYPLETDTAIEGLYRIDAMLSEPPCVDSAILIWADVPLELDIGRQRSVESLCPVGEVRF